MEILKDIFLLVVIIAITLLFIFAVLMAIKLIFIYPFSNYYLKRKTNKLQWKAIETDDTREIRINPLLGFLQKNKYNLQYRILPSELPTFVNVFRDNGWKDFENQHPFSSPLTFNRESDFIEFVSQFETYGDLLEYYKKFDDKITWIHP